MYALQGIRVADFTTMIAGSYTTTLLADLGADVVKIEPLDGEPWRHNGGGMFMGANRGKRAIAVDVRPPEGREVVHRLVAVSDAFVENARPGITKKLGLDYETLVGVKPDLIYATISGFGTTGPEARSPGYDPLAQARGGIMSAQGGAGNTPVFMKIAVNDMASPMLAAYGIGLALYQRQKTGRGQVVETSLINASAAMQSGDFLDYAGLTRRRIGEPEAKGLSATYRLYGTKDGWIFVLCAREEHWPALCRAMDHEALLADPRFRDRESRAGNDASLVSILQETFRERTAADWLSRFAAAAVPASPQLDFDQVMRDPHLLQNEALVDHDHPVFGRVRQPGIIPRFSETPGKVQRPAPLLGQHTVAVLRELGYSPTEIRALRDARIVDWPSEGA